MVKKRYRYKKGHECYFRRTVSDGEDKGEPSKITKRLPRNVYDKVIVPSEDGKELLTPDADGVSTNVRVLRPSSPESTIVEQYLTGPAVNEVETYRLLHLRKTAELFNQGFKKHMAINPTCAGDLTWDIKAEEQRGLCWRENLMCTECSFKTVKVNLFSEEAGGKGKRGRKYAAPNLAVQVGLAHSAIGNSSFRNILLACQIPAPGSSAMEGAAKRVGQKLVEINKEDKNRICEDIRNINVLRGLDPYSPINAESDVQYNNPIYASKDGTFQAATQATTTIIEDCTPSKQIIGVFTANKLCRKGQALNRKGNKVQCPNHSDCTQNVEKDAVIGDEGKWTKNAYKDIVNTGVRIKHLTTDGDSAAAKSVAKFNMDNNLNSVTNLKDTRHLGEAMRRNILNTSFSHAMWPVNKVEERERMKKRFAQNVKRRCQAEFKSCFQKSNGCLSIMKRSLSYATDAIIACYKGDCGQLCRLHSNVCSGKMKKKWKKDYLLMERKQLKMSEEDEVLLRNCISMRLGPKALNITKFNTTTQKCEATNRRYLRANPKTVTRSRNYPARIHSMVHFSNNGIAKSTLTKCQAVGAPFLPGTKSVRGLQREEIKDNKKLMYNKSEHYKAHRCKHRMERIQLHNEKEERKHYEKGLTIRRIEAFNHDHPYTARVPRPSEHEHSYSKV